MWRREGLFINLFIYLFGVIRFMTEYLKSNFNYKMNKNKGGVRMNDIEIRSRNFG